MDLTKDEILNIASCFGDFCKNNFNKDFLSNTDKLTEVTNVEKKTSSIPHSESTNTFPHKFIDSVLKNIEIRSGYIETEKKPTEYTDWEIIGRKKTQPRNGEPENTYTYYKGKKYGTYAFINENSKRKRFIRIGRPDLPSTVVGKFLTKVVSGKEITKNQAIKLRYVYNSEHAKAVFDILEIEGYLEKLKGFNYDARTGDVYTRTTKTTGLELRNNIGTHTAPFVISNPQVAMQVSHS